MSEEDLAESELEAEEVPELLYEVPVTESTGQIVLHPSKDEYLDLAQTLYGDGYRMCIDLCVVDYLTNMERQVVEGVKGERFELVVNLLDLDSRRRIRLRLQVPQDSLDVPTLTDIHPGTEAMEREAFDMFGLNFVGHPDLTRILLPEEWEGHPLRKDYSMGRIPVQFKAPQGR
jgi:NADH-quinone oxidoreductase subunit C